MHFIQKLTIFKDNHSWAFWRGAPSFTYSHTVLRKSYLLGVLKLGSEAKKNF